MSNLDLVLSLSGVAIVSLVAIWLIWEVDR